MIPAWMPLGAVFWIVVSGVAFVLAGLGIVSGVLDVLAARLLALMFFIFSLVVLLPLIFVAPRNHISWGANIYNLSAVASAWIMAEWLEAHGRAGLRGNRFEGDSITAGNTIA